MGSAQKKEAAAAVKYKKGDLVWLKTGSRGGLPAVYLYDKAFVSNDGEVIHRAERKDGGGGVLLPDGEIEPASDRRFFADRSRVYERMDDGSYYQRLSDGDEESAKRMADLLQAGHDAMEAMAKKAA